jgi:hypothetical protein
MTPRRSALLAIARTAGTLPFAGRTSACLALLGAGGLARAAEQAVNAGPYVPSPDTVVSQMLDLAEVGAADVLIDLGSGDGRIVLTAAKLRGARGLGVEIQEDLVALSIEAARREGVADRVRFARQDLFQTDVSDATVVTIYLLPHTVNMLEPKLRRELRPGTRVLSHDYPIAGWLPEAWKAFDEPEKANASGTPRATVYLYRVPAQVGGRWRATVPAAIERQPVTLELRQQWQKLDGNAIVGGRTIALEDVVLRGEQIGFRLRVPGRRTALFSGRLRDGSLEGTVDAAGSPLSWRAMRAG